MLIIIGIILAIMSALCWAISPILYKRALRFLSYLELNAVRSIGYLVFTILLVIIPYTRGNTPLIPDIKGFVFIALNTILGFVVGDLLYFVSIKHIGVSKSVAIGDLYMLVAVFLSWLILKEKITLHIIIGTITIMAGLILLKIGDSQQSDYLPQNNNINPTIGYLAAIGVAVSWGITIFSSKFILVNISLNPNVINFWRAVIFFFVAWMHIFITAGFKKVTRDLKRLSFKLFNEVVIAGVIGLGLGSVLFWWALAFAPATIVTPLSGISPLFSTLFAILALKERVSMPTLAGITCIVGGSITLGG